MSSYMEPIRFAIVVFPFLALAISTIFLFMNIVNMAHSLYQEPLFCIHLYFIYCAPIF